MWKRSYVMGLWDNTTSPSMLVGSAAHKALEHFYLGKERAESIELGLNQIAIVPDEKVKWGKTGSREKVLKTYNEAMNMFFQEEPFFHKVLAVEKSMTQFVEIGGETAALPLKCKTDLIVEDEKQNLHVVDWKFVTAYSDPEQDKALFIVQSVINALVIEKEYGKRPKTFTFNEVKVSKNKDGGRQLQSYEINLDNHPEFFTVVGNLINDCTRAISNPDMLYLPNIADQFTGQDSFENYRRQVITVESPVTQHRTTVEKFVDKKYIPSATDMEQNKFITEEEKIRAKLLEFGVSVEMKDTVKGSSVIMYTFKPSRGVKMSQLDKYDKDIALALKASSVRIEAPIMGTDLVGVEVPNPDRSIIPFTTEHLKQGTMRIPIGVDVYGKHVVKDLADMPHLLVAGSTGSGKSVMINVIIRSLIEQNSVAELKLVLIDPKRVELARYRNDLHLECPIIHDQKRAEKALQWLVDEMENRYTELEKAGAVSIVDFNKSQVTKMGKIVVVIDEAADLIMSGGPEIENTLIRLAQKARACGIHLVLGTQRPSVDVLRGTLKANIPTRIAFMTASRMDSQVILDQAGAEQLIGKGDMLLLDPHEKGLKRLQGYML